MKLMLYQLLVCKCITHVCIGLLLLHIELIVAAVNHEIAVLLVGQILRLCLLLLELALLYVILVGLLNPKFG